MRISACRAALDETVTNFTHIQDMKTRFTFGRIAAFALVAGLAAGGATASYTLSKARLGGVGGGGGGGGGDSESYARFAGNGDATAARRDAPNRCPGCRDSYDMVYLNDPRRTRDSVRVGRGDPVGGLVPDEPDYAESPHLPPPETGWGDRHPVEIGNARFVAAPSSEDMARARRAAERAAQMALAARQIERSVVQTETMHDPVTIHRPAPRPTQLSAKPTAQPTAQPPARQPNAQAAPPAARPAAQPRPGD